MPILVQDIVDRCESALDAEGFQRYTFDNDFLPAINYAKEWLVSAFNRAFADTKLSEESLRELVKVRVWIASPYSRITYNDTTVGDKLWSIFAVYPKITYAGTLAAAPAGSVSVYCPNASYIKSYKSAKRGTLEEVNQNRLNPFAAGNEVNLCGETTDYLYTFAVDYNGAYTSTPAHELEVYPSVALEPVALAYLAFPTDIDDETDYLPFPETMTNLVVNKALEWISYKQGDNTTLKMVSDEDVKTLVGLMM
jgi:hypothetical protein